MTTYGPGNARNERTRRNLRVLPSEEKYRVASHDCAEVGIGTQMVAQPNAIRDARQNTCAEVGIGTQMVAQPNAIQDVRQNTCAEVGIGTQTIAQPNAIQDVLPNTCPHFAAGLNLYKLVWIFTIGSAIGFVSETIWCWFTYGHFMPRGSLIFVPLTIIYGLGALVLYVGLHKTSGRRGWRYAFLFGVVVGTALEYFGSLAQERLLGTISWDYSALPLNIEGRVCLLFSFFWGGLSIAWVAKIQPWLESMIARIPNRVGKPLTIALGAFLAVASVVTVVALWRWTARREGIEASNAIAAWVDTAFPDLFMKSLYPNMKIVAGM